MDPTTIGLGAGLGGMVLMKMIDMLQDWKVGRAQRSGEIVGYRELTARIASLEASRAADEERIRDQGEQIMKYREALTLMRIRIRVLENEFKKTGHPLPELPNELDLDSNG